MIISYVSVFPVIVLRDELYPQLGSYFVCTSEDFRLDYWSAAQSDGFYLRLYGSENIYHFLDLKIGSLIAWCFDWCYEKIYVRNVLRFLLRFYLKKYDQYYGFLFYSSYSALIQKIDSFLMDFFVCWTYSGPIYLLIFQVIWCPGWICSPSKDYFQVILSWVQSIYWNQDHQDEIGLKSFVFPKNLAQEIEA